MTETSRKKNLTQHSQSVIAVASPYCIISSQQIRYLAKHTVLP